MAARHSASIEGRPKAGPQTWSWRAMVGEGDEAETKHLQAPVALSCEIVKAGTVPEDPGVQNLGRTVHNPDPDLT